MRERCIKAAKVLIASDREFSGIFLDMYRDECGSCVQDKIVDIQKALSRSEF
jgi:hypothetical protein